MISLAMFSTMALAGTVAIHDGSDPGGAGRTAIRTFGLARAELRTATIPELLAAVEDPYVLGATVQRCKGAPTTGADLVDALAEAKYQVLWLDYPKATVALDRAIAVILCSKEAIEHEVLADLFYTRGVTAFKVEGTSVRRYFELAIALRPDMKWDVNFDEEDGRKLFDEVRAAASSTPATSLSLLSGASSPELQVDGRPLPSPDGAIGQGAHTVQLVEGGRVTTLFLDVDGHKPVTLLSTASATESSVAWVFDPTTAENTGLVLSSVVPRGDTIIALMGDRVASLPPGATQWSTRPAQHIPRFVGPSVAVLGVVLGGGSLAGFSLTASRGQQAVAAAVAEQDLKANWLDEKARYDHAKAWRPLFAATSALGGVSLGGGLVLIWRDRRPVSIDDEVQ